MFDDFVEHAGNQATQAIPQVAQQGFEGSTPDTNVAAGPSGSSQTPIFELGRVEFPGGIPAPIISIAVCSDILAVAFANNQFYMLDLQKPEYIMKFELPKKTSELTIRKLFLDPTGKHLLLNSSQGETWYLHRSWKKPKPLKGFNAHKLVLESVAWNRTSLLSPHTTVTGPFLLGTSTGSIYETFLNAGDDFFKSQEKFLRLRYTLTEGSPVVGLGFELFPPSDAKKCLVIATTPSRIYQFSGLHESKGGDSSEGFQATFSKYKESEPLTLEIPGETRSSQMLFRNPNLAQIDSLPSSLCWSTGSGIYHSSLNFKSSSEDFLDSAELLPYPMVSAAGDPSSNLPISVCFTEFHFVYLFPDRVISVGVLDHRQDYEEKLSLKSGERALGLVMDSSRSTYWLYTNTSLFELLAVEEDRDVWSAYLEKNEHAAALVYAKSASQKNTVVLSQARLLFSEGRYSEAAQAFSQTTASFEEVALDFVNSCQTDALRLYISAKLDGTRKTDLAKRLMLATWLVELYLRKYSELEDVINAGLLSQDLTAYRFELTTIESDLKDFLRVNARALNRETVYDLFRSHGREEFLLHYATLIGDHELVINHWVSEESWETALTIIAGQTDLELYYKYSTVLMRNIPRLTTDAWLRIPTLDPTRLIPALLQQSRGESAVKHAIRFLLALVFEGGNTTTSIHNLLVTLYVSCASDEDEASFMKYLSQAPRNPMNDKPYYDIDYALRLCLQYERIRPSVLLYSDMGLWEDCVDLALSKGLNDLAKVYADKSDADPTLRKKLWLKIVRSTLEKQMDVNSAMQLLTETDAIKIEDILPFFPDFVVIDEFKEVICQALQSYSQHISLLKNEMDEAGESANSLKRDISELHKRFITVDTSAKCSRCSQSLFTRQFYVFPCQHSFHADCLITTMKAILPPSGLRKMVSLQMELVQGHGNDAKTGVESLGPQHPKNPQTQNLLSAAFNPDVFSVVGAAGSFGRGVLSAGDRLREMIVPESLANLAGGWSDSATRDKQRLSKQQLSVHTRLQEELDDIIASSCPLCDSLVNDLEKDYVQLLSDVESWRL